MPDGDQLEFLRMVTIAIFRDLPAALLAQGSLDSARIGSHLVDDNTVRMDWLWSNAVGGIKLIVKPEDAEAADEILSQPIPDEIVFDRAAQYQQPRCPKCQSLDISLDELYKSMAYGSLFVSFPLPVQRKGWICQSCRHTWEEIQPEITQPRE